MVSVELELPMMLKLQVKAKGVQSSSLKLLLLFLLGLRLITDQGSTDIQEAVALNYKYNNIDIYSNSWGPYDKGFTVEGPRILTRMALENGVNKVI